MTTLTSTQGCSHDGIGPLVIGSQRLCLVQRARSLQAESLLLSRETVFVRRFSPRMSARPAAVPLSSSAPSCQMTHRPPESSRLGCLCSVSIRPGSLCAAPLPRVQSSLQTAATRVSHLILVQGGFRRDGVSTMHLVGQGHSKLTSPTLTNSLRCLPFILDWLLMYGAEAFEGPGVFPDDNERMRWNILSNTGRRRADDATNIATPASAVVQVITGMTVYEKSSKLIEFKDVRRTAEKAMVLFRCYISIDKAQMHLRFVISTLMQGGWGKRATRLTLSQC